MRNQNGVTLATVVLTVVIIMILASTSIIVGNRLVLDAKEQKQKENYETVLAAINREFAKNDTAGIITPAIHSYIGIPNPIIGSSGAGEDWYLLDSNALLELGIKGIENTYLVNYKKKVVIDVNATEDIVGEIEKYVD